MTAPTGAGRVLVARVGAECVAFPVTSIRELLEAPQLHALPLAPAALRGHLGLRGQHVPVLDTATLLGIPTVGAAVGDADGVALVIADGSFALAVDDAVDLWEDGEASLRAVPAGADARGLLRGLLQRGTQVAGLVDPTALRALALATLRTEPHR